MRIAFVRPSMFGQSARDVMRPLVFAIVKALTPAGVDLRFFDERVESVPVGLDVDAVAMSVETFTARRAYRLADAYRAQGLPVIMGGFHPTMVPDECLAHADAVVVGDAEDTWGSVVADLAAGTLRQRYRSRNDTDLAGVDYDHSAFAGKRYRPIGVVQFGRGCRYACDFCSIHAFHGSSVRCASVPAMVEEIGRIRERHLLFVDDNLLSDRRRARELFAALSPLGKRWVCQVSMDVARDEAMLRLMRESGCFMVVVGFESLNADNLAVMRKQPNRRRTGGGDVVSDYREAVSTLHAHHLMVYGTFVFGYDFDTADGVADAARFAVENDLAIANFNPLMPMPGTPLFERLDRTGRLLHDRWWLDPGYRYGDATLSPERISPPQLTEACRRARYEFNSYSNILRRARRRDANAHSWQNLLVFLAANLVSRREIMAKQGRRLGGDAIGDVR